MAKEWTDEQKKCITSDGNNLLVAAAAGSGKTAVMVERIVTRVLNPENDVDIDRIIVVTFTKAAASEMKGRIAKRFSEELANPHSDEEKRRIKRQILLTENANIQTIDSFCNYILRNYFNTIDLDPAYRIGDTTELKLMMNDVADQVIEEAYIEGQKEFLDFVDGYVTGKSDAALSSMIIELFEFSEASPDPEEWLNNISSLYDVKDIADFNSHKLTVFMLDFVHKLAADYIGLLSHYIARCSEPDGILNYVPALTSDKELWDRVSECNDYDELRILLNTSFASLKAAPKTASPELKNAIQNMRKIMKDNVKNLLKEFAMSAADNVECYKRIAPYARVLSELTLKFGRKLMENKKSENVFSFSDIEHMALNILLTKENGEYKKTYVAEELSNVYKEIYIDEYQDSNMVQELILNAVARVTKDSGNIFMVGDIKQSIYSFRQADPSIFLEKYNTYDEKSLIVLHRNFRSDKNVLTCINDMFFRIMHENLGMVEYDEDAKLVPRDSENSDEKAVSELLLYEEDSAEDETQANEGSEAVSAGELKKETKYAKIIAIRIKELLAEGFSYKDIVILLRNANVLAEEYRKVLMDEGIPAVCTTASGYFSSEEIKVVMDFLTVIDNPRQDIPLAAVLRSYFCFLSAVELAIVRAHDKESCFFDCIVKYATEMNDVISQKLSVLLALIEKYRDKAAYLPIHELIRRIIYDTDYISYVSAMTLGKVREANLLMLINKGQEFEKTSYHGLFNFLRYIEKMAKYDIDMGNASVLSENDDVVRLMSIHKSKGLEFPVVFLASSDRKFKDSDNKKPFVFSSDYYVGLDYVDVDKRLRYKSFYKKALNIVNRINGIGEELRVLYVALTRAKTKLIIVGGSTKLSERIDSWIERAGSSSGDFSYVYNHRNYLDLTAPAFFDSENDGRYSHRIFDAASITSSAKSVDAEEYPGADTRERIFNILADSIENKEILNKINELKRRFDYEYSHKAAVKLTGKLSVSELKHEIMDKLEEETLPLVDNPKEVYEEKEDLPDDVKKVSGAERGNAYHKVFEILDYNLSPRIDDIRDFLDVSAQKGLISKEYVSYVNLWKFVAFLKSDLGKRMKAAALAGKMKREQQFVAGFSPNVLKKEYEVDDETILLQGIIDCYFEEDGEIVVVDYKTDSVSENGEQILVDRYLRQLELYRDAVSKLSGIKVKECIIYSVKLEKAISVWKSNN